MRINSSSVFMFMSSANTSSLARRRTEMAELTKWAKRRWDKTAPYGTPYKRVKIGEEEP